jgi:hypothetical protein
MKPDRNLEFSPEDLDPAERFAGDRSALKARLLDHRFAALLVAFVAVGGVAPVIQEARGGELPIVVEGLGFLALVAACYAAVGRNRHFAALLVVGVVGVGSAWVAVKQEQFWLLVLATCLLIAFFTAVAFSILRLVLTAERVTTEVIAAALCVYLLLGAIWALGYSLADTIQSTAFRTEQDSIWDFVYFSFATLTTLGYDDVVAGSRLTKSLAGIEAITGQFYVAVLVSRLVGMHIAHATAPEGPGDKP